MCSFPDEDYKSVIKRWIKIVSLTGSTSKASLFQDYAISTLSQFQETSVELEIVMTSWSELNSIYIHCKKGIVITTNSLLFQIQMSEQKWRRTT